MFPIKQDFLDAKSKYVTVALMTAHQLDEFYTEDDENKCRVFTNFFFHSIENNIFLYIRSGRRRVRQVNNNCANQAIGMTSALNCGCTCVGACLRRKAQQLTVLFRSLSVPITFTDPAVVVVVFTGPSLPTGKFFLSDR